MSKVLTCWNERIYIKEQTKIELCIFCWSLCKGIAIEVFLWDNDDSCSDRKLCSLDRVATYVSMCPVNCPIFSKFLSCFCPLFLKKPARSTAVLCWIVWVGQSVLSVTVCLFAGLSVHVLNWKWLELSTPILVDVQCMADARHALTLRSKG